MESTVPARTRKAPARVQNPTSRPRNPSGRLRGGWVLREILGRALLPHHVVRWLRRRRTQRRVPTAHADAQLLLYSRMLSGDFLHYGYFDDPSTPPEKIGFDAIHRAQLRYAEKLMERIDRPDEPVLDAGSGMGGMLGLLRSAGHDVTGLTPDRFQVAHIGRNYPGVPVLHCRFEDMLAGADAAADRLRQRFGTVIHSESIQYMEPRATLGVMREILAPGGTWIVADYFRTGAPAAATSASQAFAAEPASPSPATDASQAPAAEPPSPSPRDRSGWRLDDFRDRLAATGFEIALETDITANVLPTLGFAHLLATRIGLPAVDFAAGKLRAKRPALHYVVENVADRILAAAHQSAAVIDPAVFAARKRYILMTIRRS